jgi:hypothetical protein
MFCTNWKFFRESKFRDNLNQGYLDLKFMIVRDEIIWGCVKRQDENGKGRFVLASVKPHINPSSSWAYCISAVFILASDKRPSARHRKLCSLHTVSMYSIHGRVNYKDIKAYMSAFISVDMLTDFAAFCLTDFIDWRCTHSWFVFRPILWTVTPHGWGGTILVNCWVLPLYCNFSLTSSPFPMYSIYRVQTMCDCGGGGVEMYCGPYSAGVLHSVSDQIRNLQNCFTAPNKMTSRVQRF